MDETRSVLGKRKTVEDHEANARADPSTISQPEPNCAKSPSMAKSTIEGWSSLDGTTDRLSRMVRRAPVSAIFVHAGAGYHSVTNETIHLKACSEAVRAGMRILHNGYSALEAVEAAIKVLEDKEIANAGFGSNLSIDGTVECDATIVDHLGRSGAVGAVSNIKNPISLARLVLEQSRKPLSLRRVPPNLLVGEGAKDFATEHGMPLVPNAWLVSKNAQDRFIKWEQDLRRAEGRDALDPTTAGAEDAKISAVESHDRTNQPLALRDHTKAIQNAVWNEGQPDSPATVSSHGSRQSSSQTSPLPSPGHTTDRNPSSIWSGSTRTATSRGRMHGSPRPGNHGGDASYDLHLNLNAAAPRDQECLEGRTLPRDIANAKKLPTCRRAQQDQDCITDTVGAIAIDQAGNIAAASSSGGIGMKHRGRVGPAALVGVGTTVIPQDEADEDGVSVAAVTSGTGEHMATTMASQKCAERIYQWTKRGEDGADVAADDESAILDSFITNDFQQHPGVRNSTSMGAIGVMAVKKSLTGFYLYFAHNTDSFALASMASTDREPMCVMSRLSENSHGVSQGARKIDLK